MAYHKIYRYTSIGRPLEPGLPAHKALLVLMPLGALLGAVYAWMDGQAALQVLRQALYFLLIVYSSWALARELDPDNPMVAYISLVAGMLAALAVDSPGILIVFTTLGLVRMVNRSSGLAARQSDSIILLIFVLLVIYDTGSPFYGVVAGAAFFLDGILREPLRRQWVFGMVCMGGTVVYMVDHDTGFSQVTAPDSLFGWLAVLFLLIFVLNTLLLKSVQSKGDSNGKALDAARVRGGMAIGFLAALQGISRPDQVVIIIAVIAGICFGMAFRKGFQAPATG